MSYDDIETAFAERLRHVQEQNQKQSEALERAIVELSGRKVPWYKPWQWFGLVRDLQRTLLVVGNIASHCLKEQLETHEGQTECLQIQKAQQDQIVRIVDVVKRLEG